MSANNSKTDINFIEEQIKALSPEDRAALLSRRAPTVVFCGSSVVSFGSAVQVNGSQDLNAFVQINGSQDLNAFIDKIPPEALGEFLKAIGAYRKFGLKPRPFRTALSYNGKSDNQAKN